MVVGMYPGDDATVGTQKRRLPGPLSAARKINIPQVVFAGVGIEAEMRWWSGEAFGDGVDGTVHVDMSIAKFYNPVPVGRDIYEQVWHMTSRAEYHVEKLV